MVTDDNIIRYPAPHSDESSYINLDEIDEDKLDTVFTYAEHYGELFRVLANDKSEDADLESILNTIAGIQKVAIESLVEKTELPQHTVTMLFLSYFYASHADPPTDSVA